MTVPARLRSGTRFTDVRARPNARPITAWLDPAAAAAAIASSRSRRTAPTRRDRNARRSRSASPPQTP
jgi:hypothetical protein